jgi:hypothetical protein
MKINSWKLKRWTVCVIALVSFGAGSLITARLAHINQVRADSNRVFEMHVYHTVPGKVPALESQFRDRQSKLLAKHDLKIVGYWVPEGRPIGTTPSFSSWLIPAGRKRKRTGMRCEPTQIFKR